MTCTGINHSLTISTAAEKVGYLRKEATGDGAMVGKLTRVAFLLFMAVMIVSWAVEASKSRPAEPQDDQPMGRMYS